MSPANFIHTCLKTKHKIIKKIRISYLNFKYQNYFIVHKFVLIIEKQIDRKLNTFKRFQINIIGCTCMRINTLYCFTKF